MNPIDIWLFHENDWPTDDAILTDDERAIVARYRFEDDRRRNAAGRILLRQLLAERLGVPPQQLQFDISAYGKPSLRGASIEFNLTHSGSWIGMAISETPVGIDVEQVKPQRDLQGLARRYFLDHEREWIAAQDDPVRAFFRMWTMKESVLKADGRGMSLPLADVSIHPEERVAVVPTGQWRLTELEFDDGYAGSVAGEGVAIRRR